MNENKNSEPRLRFFLAQFYLTAVHSVRLLCGGDDDDSGGCGVNDGGEC